MDYTAFGMDRRHFLAGIGMATVWLTVPGAFAEELVVTPAQGEGPFYPDKLPLDTDNDLLVVNNSITPAVGAVTRLSGRVLDRRGDPVRGATIEIWQVDSKGAYIHSGSQNYPNRDVNFQGYGRFETSSSGEYQFRTVKPVAYGNRAPHIHVKVDVPRRHQLITQLYVKGEPKNATDSGLNRVKEARERNALIVPFAPIAGSRIGELAARFDIVLGFTPAG